MTVIGVISAKGGVGKTTTVTNLGIALVRDFGKKVLVIDGNITTPTLGLQLGILSQERNVDDVLEGKESFYQATYIHPSGLHVVPASLSLKHPYPEPEKLREKLLEVRDKYDFILIDGAAGIGREVIATIEASDSVLVVTNPEVTSVVAAIKAIKISKSLNIHVIGIVLNKATNKDYELKINEIKELGEMDIISVIPYDKKILKSIKKMKPVYLYHDSNSKKSFQQLAAYLTGEGPQKKGLGSRLKSFFRLG